jgi:hypothetical protein
MKYTEESNWMAGGYSMSHLTVKWKENSTPSPHTHTCRTLRYYVAGCCYLHVGISILTEISDSSWWEIWQKRCKNAPINPSPDYKKTCPDTNKCKRTKLQKFQQQVHCQVYPAHGVRSTNSYKRNECETGVCVRGIIFHWMPLHSELVNAVTEFLKSNLSCK